MTGEAIFLVEAPSGRKRVALQAHLSPEAAEAAEELALDWIKSLRHLEIDGRPFRERFTYHGDSLWWFAELYLAKQGAIRAIFRTLLALEELLARERSDAVRWVEGDDAARHLAPQVAARLGVRYRGPSRLRRGWQRRVRLGIESLGFATGTVVARRRALAARPIAPGGIVAFLHAAFWRAPEAAHPPEEGYIGPVLSALRARLPPGGLHLVGLGPDANFRARRWWTPLAGLARGSGDWPFVPVEAFAGLHAVRPSLALWRCRHAVRRALLASPALRAAARIRGCDAWPLIARELAGVALLQFPWSARAMDEAAAALEYTRPAAVVTYAEAGGWGRALVLEARRRDIPVVGLQHGFIYRHWVNYRHEPDEMAPSSVDPGFPQPDVTLLFDELAARHLEQAGHFPRARLLVTGSPRLDALVAGLEPSAARAAAAGRAAAAAAPDRALVLVASKFSQIGPVFGALLTAAAAMPDVHVVVKCHPAETPAPYLAAAAGAPHVSIAPASADLAGLLAEARLVVTVNSTVAIDAMVIGVPTLVLALPNNLTPFVEAGVMAGAADPEKIGPVLRAVLYDERRRLEMARRSQAFMTRFAIASDGRAAARSAEAILAVAARRAGPPRAEASETSDGGRL